MHNSERIYSTSMNCFHHTSTVVPLLLSSVLSATIPAIEFDKTQSFQPASQPAPWPPLTSCLSSCCLPSRACREPKLRWRQMLWMTDSPGEQRQAKQNEARTVDKKNTTTQHVRNLWLFEGSAILKHNNC